MANQVMVFKIPKEIHKELTMLGELEERTKAFLIRKAIKLFLEEQKKQNGKTTRGIDAI